MKNNVRAAAQCGPGRDERAITMQRRRREMREKARASGMDYTMEVPGMWMRSFPRVPQVQQRLADGDAGQHLACPRHFAMSTVQQGPR